ncbi:MAG: Sll0314/Alr1548 family TPR repeat-containing protein [Cyanobacteria bacterium J06638_20]
MQCSPLKRFTRAGWRWGASFIGGCAIALTLAVDAGLADPFRSSAPKQVGDRTEQAFDAMFREGNYSEAREILRTAEEDEPLNYALQASIAFLGEDWDILQRSATRTRESAEALVDSDPLRGHLYIAVGHFLEGAYIAQDEGLVAATPDLLRRLQLVFNNFNQAEDIDPNDPEINLIRGFMDLILAVHLPFSDPSQAIERLEERAGPSYMASRGLAVGYRDLGQFEEAIAAVDTAIAAAPDNPELYYLKAQILVDQGNHEDSLEYFALAMEGRDQLVKQVGNRLAWEQCRTQNRVDGVDDNTSRAQCRELIRD